MNQILTLREKRAKAWDAAKAFLDTKRGTDGLLSAEDVATYEKMEADVVSLGKEIDRLERQANLDRELSQPTTNPITNQPAKAARPRMAAPPTSTPAPSGRSCATRASATRCTTPSRSGRTITAGSLPRMNSSVRYWMPCRSRISSVSSRT